MTIKNVMLLIFVFIVTGCAKQPVIYKPSDFTQPVQVKKEYVKVPVAPMTVNATYGIGNDPAVIKAYNDYIKTGKAYTIRTPGFRTEPFSPNNRILISCSPLHMCVIELEQGEKILSKSAGDTTRWVISQVPMGEGEHTAMSVTAKPTDYAITTDLLITTNKRTYYITLVSKKGQGSQILRFYYPYETAMQGVSAADRYFQKQVDHSDGVDNNDVIASMTHVDLKNINFAYQIKGDNPPWRPLRVFDDNNKTYIQLSAQSSHFELPVLYLAKNKEMQLVNYRYRKPYFVIDGLFKQAWLISGKGSDQVRVEIINQKSA